MTNQNMMRLFASVFLLALTVPSDAGIALINGGGTGGLIAHGEAGSGTTVTSAASTVDVPVGSLVFIGISQRTITATVSSCTDTAGNTFQTPVNKGLASNAQTSSFTWAITTIDEPIGTTWTCNTSGTVNKGLMVAAFSSAAASPLDAASATPVFGSGTAVSVGPTGTLACPGTGNCEVLIGFFSHHNIGAVTEGTGFTSFGTITNLSANMHMAYQIVAANTAITYAPTAGNSDIWAAFLEAFVQSTGAPACPRTRMLLGVGC